MLSIVSVHQHLCKCNERQYDRHIFCEPQDQRAWLIQQVEGLQPLPRSLARRALRALVSADAFERFLASSFPASKVP